jgi:signal transduction histidine kinase/ActR/RegA family two-component response regulator
MDDNQSNQTRDYGIAQASFTGHADSAALIERAVLASISDGVIVNNVQGQVILINQAAMRMLQSSQNAVGANVRDLFDVFSSRGRMTMVDALNRLYADPYSFGPGEGITETMFEIGMQVIQAHLSPVLTEIGEFLGIVTVLRDITKEVESERAKTEFVSNVSHELRTPLTAIKGYSDLLLAHSTEHLSDSQLNFLNIIQKNANCLVSLINDLLDISRVESGRMELDIRPVQLESIIHDVADMVRPQCDQKRLTLVVEIMPNPCQVLGDRKRLLQVVTNLASNACRYTPEGGRITLALSSSDGAVRVDVRDTGIGIAPADQGKVFQRFYRVNNPMVNAVSGTGLGLPIAKMLVEMHGGKMWVESAMGKGSAFTFVLPVHAAAPEPPPEEKQAQRTVLVVEDEEDLAELIALPLLREGFKVLTATRGKEALALAQNNHIDLITLDMMLPDITGMEVLRLLKADSETAAIPVIIVSVIQPKAAGVGKDAADHISKPFAIEKLMDSVHRTLAAQVTRP